MHVHSRIIVFVLGKARASYFKGTASQELASFCEVSKLTTKASRIMLSTEQLLASLYRGRLRELQSPATKKSWV